MSCFVLSILYAVIHFFLGRVNVIYLNNWIERFLNHLSFMGWLNKGVGGQGTILEDYKEMF